MSRNSIALEALAGTAQIVSGGTIVTIYGDASGFTTSVRTAGGGPWLTVRPNSGGDDVEIQVTASARGLAAGTYTGSVNIIVPPANNSPLAVNVTFVVRSPLPSTLRSSGASLSFSSVAEGNKPLPQTLTLTREGESVLAWKAAAITANGGNWLSLSAAAGPTPGDLVVAADTRNLGPGTYVGRIVLTADGLATSPTLTIPVTLVVAKAPTQVTAEGVVNAASGKPGPVAPGEILSIFGGRLGPADGIAFTMDPVTRQIPRDLGGSFVSFDGIKAPLYYVSARQINAQVPYEIAGRTTTKMTVGTVLTEPVDITMQVRPSSPAFFTSDGVRAAALNQDGSFNSAQNPAPAGTIVVLFFNGQGAVTPLIATGAPAGGIPIPGTADAVRVIVDGRTVNVLFSGLAPGFVGLSQLNLQLSPDAAPNSSAIVQLNVGGIDAPPVTLAIKAAPAPAPPED